MTSSAILSFVFLLGACGTHSVMDPMSFDAFRYYAERLSVSCQLEAPYPEARKDWISSK
jgi:hypothetical protein